MKAALSPAAWLYVAVLAKMMGSPRRKRRAFVGYTPTLHDVFVCTYAKSGTNWAMQIALQIAHGGRGEFGHVHDLVPWPEGPPFGTARLNDPDAYRAAPTGLRVIKTHAERPFVPYRPEAKYLVVVRDPADVLVSALFFWNSLVPPAARVSPEAWYRLFLEDRIPFGSWAEHVASYEPWRERQNVLFLSYREMRADLPGTVERVAALMGATLTEEERAAVVHRSSFAYMKGVDHKFAPQPPGPVRWLGGGRATMMRRGEAGAAGELYTAAQQTEVRRVARARLLGRGSAFPFDETFGGERVLAAT